MTENESRITLRVEIDDEKLTAYLKDIDPVITRLEVLVGALAEARIRCNGETTSADINALLSELYQAPDALQEIRNSLLDAKLRLAGWDVSGA